MGVESDQPLRAHRQNLGACWALGLLVAASCVTAQPLQLGERLEYTVSYQGILSAWQPFNIAKAVLEIDPQLQQINDERLLSAHLFVTTKRYSTAERFYPIRYTFRSWFEPAARYTRMVDELRREEGFSQSLLWFDQAEKVVQRYKRSNSRISKTEVLPTFLRQRYVTEMALPSGFRKKKEVELKLGMLDHLSLLYRMRMVALEPGTVIDLPASDGKDLIGYRVEVLGEELLSRGAEHRMTMKVKFEPQDRHEGGLDAIYVWYAMDRMRTPIRVYSSRLFGNIEFSLDGKQPGEHWRGEQPPQPLKKIDILELTE
ncbi:MAG: DUF3108 domain-containing protein [Candidatus Polarisedimenticolaceae bacterium]|nr:DUF3108 domain-containing protein [Candidatus Polarisedimenticolaceae bacterium]